jgi:hypothetical protein
MKGKGLFRMFGLSQILLQNSEAWTVQGDHFEGRLCAVVRTE